MQAEPNTTVQSSDLRFQRSESLQGRGSIAEALQRGIFEAPFGASYYRGWADSTGTTFAPLPQTEVVVSAPAMVSGEWRRPEWHRPAAYAAFGVSALTLGAGAYLGIRSHHNSDRYNGNPSDFASQSAALATRDTARHQAVAADVLLGTGIAAGISGLVLMLWNDTPVVPAVAATPGGALFVVELR